MGDRYTAALSGYALECETIEDSWEKAIALYEYPYRDGAATEDMGQRARTIRLRCYFLGAAYDGHFDFLNLLRQRELFELTHPKYGIVSGRVESVYVYHDDRDQTAEVDIAFVQDLESQEAGVETYYLDVAAAAEESFTEGQDELMGSFSDRARAVLGYEAETVLGRVLDPALGIVAQFTDVSQRARRWLRTVESFVTTVQAAAIEVATPANTLVAMMSYGTQLPGRVIGSLARCFDRYGKLYESLVNSPNLFLRNLSLATDDLVASAEAIDDVAAVPASITGCVRAAGAQRMALDAATILKADEAERDKLRRRERATAGTWDISGHYTAPEAAAALLTVQDLEAMLTTVRTQLAATVAYDRQIASAKTMARDLLEHVSRIMIEREKIVQVALGRPMPLHLVCLMRGLPYAYAERLLAINRIAHPNFVSGVVNVYAR